MIPGDAYDQYVRPFRTIEDVHLTLATLADVLREAQHRQRPARYAGRSSCMEKWKVMEKGRRRSDRRPLVPRRTLVRDCRQGARGARNASVGKARAAGVLVSFAPASPAA